MTTRATLKMETMSGPALYAGRTDKVWHISLPGGTGEEFVGNIYQVVERMEELAKEFGGAGRLFRQLEAGFVPYKPGQSWDKSGYLLLQGAC